MIQNGYTEKINVKYSEVEHNHAMKPYALLNFLQDIASKNAEDGGFGYSSLYPRGYAWFLIKYRMEFKKYPFGVGEYELTTEPRGYNKLFAFREFSLAKEGQLLARMYSQWAIADFKTRSMIPVADVVSGNKYMVPHVKRDDDLNFSKIRQINNVDYEKAFEVRYNDLDINGHANNGNYIIWAFEPLNFEFRNARQIKTIDMVYKKEAVFGETVISQIELKDDYTTLHTIKNSSGEDLCQVECTWINN